ncbi:MAG: C-GCAxxG-C-C family protein [Muribaculaceae bacterium]|nr:C-GCAxxG-C-C family protein [Muribaculaceae bacterium]
MKKYSEIDPNALVDRGVELFMQGFNCSQSVVGAFAHLYSIPFDTAMRISASFGGGLGRMRLTCGAASGMCLLAGLETGCTNPSDNKGKGANYAVVQQLLSKFKECNGSITCSELLGLKKDVKETPDPSDRNAQYYASRPCAKMVATACKIYADYLLSITE